MTSRCRNAVVMGVCGVGKTSVAQRLADAFGGRFLEGDQFHSPANVRSMSKGIPLTDEARRDWLESICEAVKVLNARDDAPVFVACSALKRRYRDRLREGIGDFALLHLDGDRDLISQRLTARRDHFMPPALLDSQLHDLEPPDQRQENPLLRLDMAPSLERVMNEAILFCRHHVAGAGRSVRGDARPPADNFNEDQRPKTGGNAP